MGYPLYIEVEVQGWAPFYITSGRVCDREYMMTHHSTGRVTGDIKHWGWGGGGTDPLNVAPHWKKL